MKHRDHISLGLLVFSGVTLGTAFTKLAAFFIIIFPAFLSLDYLPRLAVFLAGVSFPDTDQLIWPKKAMGHRMLTPFHVLSTPIILTVACALLYWLLPQPARNLINEPLGLFSAFTFGWFVHLLGDVIQGGVRLGFGSKKRFGITSFNWKVYTESLIGTLLSLALKGCGLAAYALTFTLAMDAGMIAGTTNAIAASALVLQAIGCGNAVTFLGFLAVYSLLYCGFLKSIL
ncbi:MAG: hypothetical protein Q4D58_04020 [Synergistaceae bacterium]|nr:hypothetical protein [Synergistaceae bacterium]